MTVAAVAPKLSKRVIKRISLDDFEQRKPEITQQLMEAATDLGFFMVELTGITQAEVPFQASPASWVRRHLFF